MHRERSAAPAPSAPRVTPAPAPEELFKFIYFLISETKNRDAAGSPGRRAAPALPSDRCGPGFAVHGFQLLLLCSATRPLGLVSMCFFFFLLILFFIVVINLFSCLLQLLHRLMEGRGAPPGVTQVAAVLPHFSESLLHPGPHGCAPGKGIPS